MKSKLILLTLIAAGSAFAETRFSISIGAYPRGYYAPAPVYRGPVGDYVPYRSHGRSYGGSSRGWSGAGYWGENPARRHEQIERQGLYNHQQIERFMYGDSPELWEHQAQEQWELRHEQWHERNGDFDAADGPAHGSARDGYYHDRY